MHETLICFSRIASSSSCSQEKQYITAAGCSEECTISMNDLLVVLEHFCKEDRRCRSLGLEEHLKQATLGHAEINWAAKKKLWLEHVKLSKPHLKSK
jgi:hypothetical protein